MKDINNYRILLNELLQQEINLWLNYQENLNERRAIIEILQNNLFLNQPLTNLKRQQFRDSLISLNNIIQQNEFHLTQVKYNIFKIRELLEGEPEI
tara:strand:+ start:187 stop:474 length:288 start_codon:yes stop_codon:yes gene_type:complete